MKERIEEKNALMEAIQCGRTKFMRLLVEEQKEDVNYKSSVVVDSIVGQIYKTPLFEAVSGGNLDTVEYLVEHGAYVDGMPPNEVDPADELATPLCLAVARGYLEIAEFLLENNANIWPNSHGLFCWALSIENKIDDNESEDSILEMVQLLVKHNANIDERNCDGQTPLSMAMRKSQLKVVQYLLDKGANYKRGDLFTGYLPIISAIDREDPFGNVHGNPCALKLLIDFIEKKEGKEALVKYLNDNYNINARTALHEACAHGWYEAAELLLQRGICPYRRDLEVRLAHTLVEDRQSNQKFNALFEKHCEAVKDPYLGKFIEHKENLELPYFKSN